MAIQAHLVELERKHKILENEFKISARRTGDVADVIEETALEVRTSLGNSLAAAKSDRTKTGANALS